MNYQSTRDRSAKVSAARAIVQGISHEGGLFVPETLPVLTPEELEGLVGLSYNEKAKAVLSRFLTDFTPDGTGRPALLRTWPSSCCPT